jgi:predicted anti-sigma-YlaC factor YlaD
MNCLDCQELLQRRLDGEALPEVPELERHLSACRLCRERHAASIPLLESLKSLPWPASPAQLTQHLVVQVLQDRRRRQRRLRLRIMVTTALAASLLLMALAGYLWLPTPKTPEPLPNIVQKDKKLEPEPAPDMAKSMDDARNAVVTLTGRLADQTKQQAQILLAAASPMDVPPLVNVPAVAEGMDATQTLRQAGQGLSDGLEPVTRSTRRALQFLAREVAAFDAGAN